MIPLHMLRPDRDDVESGHRDHWCSPSHRLRHRSGEVSLSPKHPRTVAARSVMERIRYLATPGIEPLFGEIPFWQWSGDAHAGEHFAPYGGARSGGGRFNPRRLGGRCRLAAAATGMSRDLWSFLRYLVVGVLNTAFGYASYTIFVLSGTPLWFAVGGSTCVAIFFNFLSYGGLVFGATSYKLLPRFLIFYAALGGLNFLSLRGLTWTGVGPLLAQGLLLPILAGVGFIGLRRFVFKKTTIPSVRD